MNPLSASLLVFLYIATPQADDYPISWHLPSVDEILRDARIEKNLSEALDFWTEKTGESAPEEINHEGL